MRAIVASVTTLAFLLASCGGSDSSPSAAVTPTPSPTPTTLYAVPAQESLSVTDVQTIIAGAAAEATARSLPAVIAVTDRVGNVLAVYSMTGARSTAVTSPAPNGVSIDIQSQTVPAGGGAIAKAITGAYLSSGGNAFY